MNPKELLISADTSTHPYMHILKLFYTNVYNKFTLCTQILQLLHVNLLEKLIQISSIIVQQATVFNHRLPLPPLGKEMVYEFTMIVVLPGGPAGEY
jgi:hypothetical protein